MFETVSHFRTAGLLDDDSMLSSGLHTQIILGITIAPTCYFNLNSFFYYFDEAIRCAPLKTLRKTNTCVTISKKKKDNRKLKCQRVENGEGQPFQRIKLLLKENAARARVKNPVRKMFLVSSRDRFCVCRWMSERAPHLYTREVRSLSLCFVWLSPKGLRLRRPHGIII